MPTDIRSFFGGGPKASQDSQKQDEVQCVKFYSCNIVDNPQKPVAKKSAPKKTSRASRVVDDSDDEEEAK